jgi:hypothetical protein
MVLHAKEFNTKMFGTCFNECIPKLDSANLTANEAKCLKSCYVTFSKKLQVTGEGFGYDCKLMHDF